MDASPIELGAELRRLRRQLGLTQRQVAERLGEHFVERDIQRIESGFAGRPALPLVAALLQLFGKDLTSLVGDRPDRLDMLPSAVMPAAGRTVSEPWSLGTRYSDLAEARTRLQLAMQSSQAACRRSDELLHASHALAGGHIPSQQMTPALAL